MKIFFKKLFGKIKGESKLGLALGSGGVRGFAHAGILKCLKEAGIPIHAIAGTSAGAIIGSLFCAGAPTAGIARLIERLTSTIGTAKIFSPSFQGGIAKSERVKQYLSEFLGDKKIEDLTPRFACVATDLFAGTEVVFTEGDLLDAVGASFAIPGIFTPSVIDERILVDGAVVDPVPISVVKKMGVDVVIAVNVIGDCCDRHPSFLDITENGESGRMPSIPAVIMQALAIYQKTLFKSKLGEAMPDLLIEPKLGDIKTFSFKRGMDAIAVGYEAAKAALPDIKKLIS